MNIPWKIFPSIYRDFAGVRARTRLAVAESRRPVTIKEARAQAQRFEAAKTNQVS